jgi:hypothetical protein
MSESEIDESSAAAEKGNKLIETAIKTDFTNNTP